VYFVLAVNRENKVAYLINMNRNRNSRCGVERVPFSVLTPVIPE
jgi:hypothetical protein